MKLEPRDIDRDDEEELAAEQASEARASEALRDASTGPEAPDLARALRDAVERADASATLSLLATEVSARDGGSVLRDAGVPLEALVRAPRAGGYRDRATAPLSSALGEAAEARLLVELLARALDGEKAAEATEALRPYLATRAPLARRARDTALRTERRVLPLLRAIAPDAVALTLDEVRELTAAVRARPSAATEWLPRVALGLPSLIRRDRERIVWLVHAIAGLAHPDAPAALRTLADAGAPMDRRLDGHRPIELAIAVGALDNVRALEECGAIAGKRGAPKAKKAAKDRSGPRASSPPAAPLLRAVEQRRSGARSATLPRWARPRRELPPRLFRAVIVLGVLGVSVGGAVVDALFGHAATALFVVLGACAAIWVAARTLRKR